MDLGWPEIILILVIVLVVFGAGRLPDVGRALGKSIREFKKAQQEDTDGRSAGATQAINNEDSASRH